MAHAGLQLQETFAASTYEELVNCLNQLEADKDYWNVESTMDNGDIEDGSQKIVVFFTGFNEKEQPDPECVRAEPLIKQVVKDLGDACNALIVCNVGSWKT